MTDDWAIRLACAGLTAAYGELVAHWIASGTSPAEAETMARAEIEPQLLGIAHPTEPEPDPVADAPDPVADAPAVVDADPEPADARSAKRYRTPTASTIMQLARDCHTTPVRDAEWVYQHMGAPFDRIPVEAAPSPGAHALLVACARDPRLKTAFYQTWLRNAFTESDYAREQSVHTRTTELSGMIERLARVKTSAETGVLPNGSEPDTA